MKLKYTEAAKLNFFDKRRKEVEEKNRKKFDMGIQVKGQRKTKQHRQRGSDPEAESAASISAKSESLENTSQATPIQQPNEDETEESAPILSMLSAT